MYLLENYTAGYPAMLIEQGGILHILGGYLSMNIFPIIYRYMIDTDRLWL